MLNKIEKIIQHKKTLTIVSVLFVIFMGIVLPLISSVIEANIGVVDSPDTSLFYSVERFYRMLESYGQDGRNLYILLRWTFDLVYPLVYGSFFIVFLYRLLMVQYQYMKLLWLPVLAVVFDYLENIFATVLMSAYPNQYPLIVYLLQAFSIMKWMFVFITLLMIILLILRLLFKKKESY